MKIEQVQIKNFRGFKDLEVQLNPAFTLIIGDNGSGKTALLEAINIAIGSFFLGIKDISSRTIHRDEVHIATFGDQEEYQFPVSIVAKGYLTGESLEWKRTKTGVNNDTTHQLASKIKSVAQNLDKQIRNGEPSNLPLLAYYATGRLFNLAIEKDLATLKGKENKEIASRFRAYKRSLDAKSNFSQFQKWFRGKELASIQRRDRHDHSLELVRQAVVHNLPGCTHIYHEFDPDKPLGLKIVLEDGRILPFNSLSDGTRNYFALIADLAYKCTTLNPHLKEEALKETEGVVLIDELDLHLHPEWQRLIVNGLRETFPKVQFIATTHSPFLIQETGKNQLIILKNNQIHSITSGVNKSIEDIAEEFQFVENPQWSHTRQEMFDKAKTYYQAVKEGKDTPEMKAELDEAMKPFSLDTAFYAIIEQERIVQQFKKGKDQ
jgi:predicted ATP-binding protein involved in virulence